MHDWLGSIPAVKLLPVELLLRYSLPLSDPKHFPGKDGRCAGAAWHQLSV